MEIYLTDDKKQLLGKIRSGLERRDAGSGILCNETLKKEADQIRRDILSGYGRFDPSGPIILTGHQPVFYHPGILVKDLLAHELAKTVGGTALNIVVDTDEAKIGFEFPVQNYKYESTGGFVQRERVSLNSSGEMLRYQKLEPSRKRIFIKRLKRYESELSGVFAPDVRREISANIRAAHDIMLDCTRVVEPAVRLRRWWEQSNGIHLHTIYAGDIVNTGAFRYFLGMIVDNGAKFRQVYNGALADYRRRHKIKNAAQPLPDLDERKAELPFWLVGGGKRIPFMETLETRGREVFPRAVTLTLFCRLFLCDLFIHGRGGARYEEITDRILKDFFHCDGAPFTVASATLSLHARADYPLDSRPVSEITQEIRQGQFDPARFFSENHSLSLIRNRLIAEFHESNAKPDVLHRKFLELRDMARKEHGTFETKLEMERTRAEQVRQNQSVFNDRTFPFIFYRLDPLREAVRAAVQGNAVKPIEAMRA